MDNNPVFEQRLRSLMSAVDLNAPGLEAVRSAAAGNRLEEAGAALLDYYRRKDSTATVRAVWQASAWNTTAQTEKPLGLFAGTPPTESDRIDPKGEDVLHDNFMMHQTANRIKRHADGRIDWLDYGPRNDIEWAFALNRHMHWMALLNAWCHTGNPKYIQAVAAQAEDWITAVSHAPADPAESNSLDGRNCWPMWRNLEVGLRLCSPWPLAFFMGLRSPHMPDRVLLLILSSVAEQSPFLKKFHGFNPNHLTMEMCGLAVAALSWPELKGAREWLDYAREQIEPQVQTQVYPDGAQKELTAGYHLVALESIERFARIITDMDTRPISESYRKGMESMWNYLATTLPPDGSILQVNDSDRFDMRDRLTKAAERYGRQDWRFIVTGGQEGQTPSGLPSRYFPWAGQLVMRSGWDRNAHWAFFDCGPCGVSGHQHYDKLHLGVAAHGRHLLVDNGRYTHAWDVWRQYFIGSYGHNVILVDGHGQDEGIEVVVEPPVTHASTTPEFDFACAHMDTGFLNMQGECVHTRAVCYIRGFCWVVVDRMNIAEPRTITPLWHFHPDCTVKQDGRDVITTDPGTGNLRITPVGKIDWRVELVRGREVEDGKRYRMWKADYCPSNADEPTPQGWYSPDYGVKLPATCAVFRARLAHSMAFAWILMPASGQVPQVSVRTHRLDSDIAHLTVAADGRNVEVAMSLRGSVELRHTDGSVVNAACSVKKA